MPFNMQQSNGPAAGRLVLFVALLIAALVLLVVYSQEGEGGPLHGAQDAVVGATGRASGASAGLGAATQTVQRTAADVTADASTLTGLQEQNRELRELLAEAEEYRQEVDRLRDLLDMKQVSGVTGPVGHVIGRSANAWDQSITIDLGSADGVVSGMTVMGSTGVIGQVARSSDHSATVRLLADPDSGAAVMVQSSRANGIVRGSLAGLLYLEDVPEDQMPEVGDVIVTSGLGGSYERGLIVGTVVSVGDAASGAVGSIVVSPNDTADMSEEVIVVFQAPEVSTSAAPSASGASAQAQDQAADGNQVSLADQGVDTTDVTAVEQQEDNSWMYEPYVEEGQEDQIWQDEQAWQDDQGYSEW